MRKKLALIGAVLGCVALAAPASSFAEEPSQPPFCDGVTVHNFLQPIESLPSLHDPLEALAKLRANNVRVFVTRPLIVGEGSISVGFGLGNYSRPAHPRWNLTAKLTRVNRAGSPVLRPTELRRHLTTIDRETSRRFEFAVGPEPALYRLTVLIASRSGKRLAGFGSYYRVVAPTQRAQLELDRATYAPGETLLVRVDNLGSEIVSYGVPYSIEKLEGPEWTRAPESPKGPWIMPLLSSLPGASGSCNYFSIPSATPPGRYRVVKSVEYRVFGPGEPEPTSLTAEFEVS